MRRFGADEGTAVSASTVPGKVERESLSARADATRHVGVATANCVHQAWPCRTVVNVGQQRRHFIAGLSNANRQVSSPNRRGGVASCRSLDRHREKPTHRKAIVCRIVIRDLAPRYDGMRRCRMRCCTTGIHLTDALVHRCCRIAKRYCKPVNCRPAGSAGADVHTPGARCSSLCAKRLARHTVSVEECPPAYPLSCTSRRIPHGHCPRYAGGLRCIHASRPSCTSCVVAIRANCSFSISSPS